MDKKTFAVWDLGGTKCAAAIVHFDVHTQAFDCEKRCRIKLRDCDSLDDLVEHIEAALGCTLSETDAICIAAAGVYNGEFLELEGGYPYPMDFARLAKERAWQNMAVVHDYVPVACATFTSYLDHPGNCLVLNQGEAKALGRRVVLGIGTGLGLKDVVPLPNDDFWLGTNEAGHMGIAFPPYAKPEFLGRHREFIRFLRWEGVLGDGEPVTFEKVLSGKGLVRVHQFLAGKGLLLPEEVGHAMNAGEIPETLRMMAWYLGLFIGSLQLAFMPHGGIWLTGGVMLKNMPMCQHPDLMEGIYASPAYRKDREKMPLKVIVGEDYALLGCAYYASRRMRQ